MRLHRFYVLQPLGEEVVIDDVSILTQWTKVLRYEPDDFLILCNGDGFDYTYKIESLTKKQCTLQKESRREAYIPKRKTYLFLACIKKDNFELVVQKAVECGVTDIVPMLTDHTEKKNLDMRRLTHIITEATEQSGRGDLLVLHDILDLETAFSTLLVENILREHTYVTTLGGTPVTSLVHTKSETIASQAFFVGPEGGWSDDEEAFFITNDCVRISLGKTVLRAETAGIACAILASLL